MTNATLTETPTESPLGRQLSAHDTIAAIIRGMSARAQAGPPPVKLSPHWDVFTGGPIHAPEGPSTHALLRVELADRDAEGGRTDADLLLNPEDTLALALELIDALRFLPPATTPGADDPHAEAVAALQQAAEQVRCLA